MLKVLLGLSLTGICFTKVFSQADKVEFSSGKWSYWDNGGSKISKVSDQYKNYNAIDLKDNEIALLENTDYENFRLEMDMAGSGMAGLGFRSNDFFNYELMYFRLTSGGTLGAIQYVPVFNGSTGWMLYPKNQGTVNFKADEWFHVTVEVKGELMKIFVNNSDKPDFEVRLLRRDLTKGKIFLKSEFSPCYYANVKIRSIDPSMIRDASNKMITDKFNNKYLINWTVSEQFVLNEPLSFWALDRVTKELKGWRKIDSNGEGIINLSKYFKHPKNTVCVKTILTLKDDTSKELIFDYAYSAMIVLNSKIIFFGKEMDDFGHLNDGEQRIDLSLNKGDNELLLFITGDTETYGGEKTYQGRTQAFNWGFISRLNDYDGIIDKETK